MSCRALKILGILLMVMTFSFARANEAAPAGEAGKEEKKDIKSAEDSFSVVQARVQTLEAKVHSGQEELEKLIEEKQHTTDPKQVGEIVKQMLGLHKELRKNVKEYDQQRALLKYRYPEKGLTEKREYERIDVKSIEDMETQMSLSTSVKKTLKKVRSQYETLGETKARLEKASERSPDKKSSKPTEPSLVEPVILKK